MYSASVSSAWRLAAVSGSRKTPSRITAAPSDSSVRSTRMRSRILGRQLRDRQQPAARRGALGGRHGQRLRVFHVRHNNFMNFDKELDAHGLNCPLPILRTKKALTDMASGKVLKVVATDRGAVKDFQTFSRQTGHELMSHAEADKEFTFFMRKK